MLALVAFSGVAIACALLSLVVVARRWAFIGEGIGHSGFGGAGTAWLLMALSPTLDDIAWLPYACVVVFALAAGLGMGVISRRGQISGDVAIGIFLVATVAWGFIGERFYRNEKGVDPAGFSTLFFGQPEAINANYTLAAAIVAVAVVMTVVALRKEILAYCIDPNLAEVSGVSAGFVHYLLITLVAITTIVGMQIVGTLLITALLILPAATANRLSKQLAPVTAISIGVGLAGAIGGFAIHRTWHAIPSGPAVVLVMVGLFILAAPVSRVVKAN